MATIMVAIIITKRKIDRESLFVVKKKKQESDFFICICSLCSFYVVLEVLDRVLMA